MSRPRLPWKSRVTAIGTAGPTTRRTAAMMSPSPSSRPSGTMAPCRSRSTPSSRPAAPRRAEGHAGDPPRGRETGQQALLAVLVDAGGAPPRRRGGRRHRGHQARTEPLGGVDHAAQAGAGAAVGLDDLAAVAQVAG